MQPWSISKRLRLPPIIEGHSQAHPRHRGTTPPGHCTWVLVEFIVHRPGVAVGWALRNGGGGYGLALWSVTKGWVNVKFKVKKRYVTLEWPLSAQTGTRTDSPGWQRTYGVVVVCAFTRWHHQATNCHSSFITTCLIIIIMHLFFQHSITYT